MSYPAYNSYQKTDFDWLATIPEHWRISKVRYEFNFDKGLTITKANLEDSGVPCVNYGEVHSKYGFEVDPEKHPLKFVNEEYLVSSPKSLLSNGDFVFADTSEDIDGSGNFTQLVGDKQIFAGYHTVILRPSNCENYKRYLAYLFDSTEYRNQIRDFVKGVKVFSITQGILKGTSLWLPPLEEQTTIANFLDRETAKIDVLIEKQEQLIKLLQEKRRAVISHTVTKGLDPNVKMKDSGVEWLGKVPNHWAYRKVAYMFKQNKRQNFPNLNVLSVYRDYGVILKSSRDDNNNKTPDNLQSYQLVEPGDLVVNKMKAWQGSMGISKHCGITSPDYVVFRPTHGEYGEFVHHSLRAHHMPDVYKIISNGVRPAQWRLEPEKFSQLFFYFPSYDEQVEIVRHIERINQICDLLISKARDSISLMQERRNALVSAAVSGKIDVRNAA